MGKRTRYTRYASHSASSLPRSQLTSAAMTVYEPRVLSKVDLLLSRIAKHSGEPINATDYIMFFGFDVMGEIGEYHSLIAAVRLNDVRILSRLSPARI